MIKKYSIGILLTVGLLVIVLAFSSSIIYYFTGLKSISATTFAFSRILIWLVLFIIFLYVIYIEKGPFLLWKEKKYPLWFFIISVPLLYIICVFGSGLINAIVHLITHEKISGKLLQMKSIFKENYLLIFFTCFTAGVVEELLMRGYLQPRLEKMYNNSYIGIFVSAFIFGILHVAYGTISQFIGPFIIGIVLAFFYKKYSNIFICILVHFLIDFVSLNALVFINTKHLVLF